MVNRLECYVMSIDDSFEGHGAVAGDRLRRFDSEVRHRASSIPSTTSGPERGLGLSGFAMLYGLSE